MNIPHFLLLNNNGLEVFVSFQDNDDSPANFQLDSLQDLAPGLPELPL